MARNASNLHVLHRPTADDATLHVVTEPPLLSIEKKLKSRKTRDARVRLFISVVVLLTFVGMFVLAHGGGGTEANSVIPLFFPLSGGTQTPAHYPTAIVVVNGVRMVVTVTPTSTQTPTVGGWFGWGGAEESTQTPTVTKTPVPGHDDDQYTDTPRPPTLMPTRWPTKQATNTRQPTKEATEKPTKEPTVEPTEKFTPKPTKTERPTIEKPTPRPTKTEKPTVVHETPTRKPNKTSHPTKTPNSKDLWGSREEWTIIVERQWWSIDWNYLPTTRSG